MKSEDKKLLNTTIPRSEHPRPQFVRENWQSLNGEWQFELDNSRSGMQRGLQSETAQLKERITVPFCPQSRLSGLEYKDFIYGLWYKRSFNISEESLRGRTFINFGAVDYKATVFVNGTKVGTHNGGYTSFKFEITDFIHKGENTVTVYAEDDERDSLIPRGKQCELFHSQVCDYTRTSGIWQTVWLEFTTKEYIYGIKYYPDVENTAVTLEVQVCGSCALSVDINYDGTLMASAIINANSETVRLTLPLKERHLWEIGNGRLYDVELSFGEDKVISYFGLREVKLDGMRFLLNGRSVFQRLVLDQGFYPDGIYTAPNDAALIRDIDLSLSCGFNGARLHQKIFEERFLYHCDRKGYIVWGEYPDWGLDFSNPMNIYSILPEWIEAVERDFNHPSIVMWCPHNETWDYKGAARQYDPSIRLIYNITKRLDNTRPCVDTSGGIHTVTDLYDIHDYTQDCAVFKARYDRFLTHNELFESFPTRQCYGGQAVSMSEFGGIKWAGDSDEAWGYGEAPKTAEEFLSRFDGLCSVIMDNPKFMGFCYTQLTDVEQEQNGIFKYDRTPKFDTRIIKKTLLKSAAIEEEG